jgi:hypothetical protein
MTDPGLIPVPDDLNLGATIRGYVAGQRLFDRYALQQVLGRGGMGVVWLAKDEKLDQPVALKFLPETLRLDNAALDELKRETRRGLALAHPHIVRIYDFVDDATAAAISMEYVDGRTLSALRIEQPLRVFDTPQLTDWMTQLVEALDYAHRRAKIVHRDLKPANLMTTGASELKVADFGIARSISDSVSRVSVKGASSGTLVYMSPQQAQGQSPKASDDIYALGATLYELLTSKPPFHSGNIQHQLDTVTAPSMAERRADFEIQAGEIPREWEQVVAACLAKDPRDRPESIAQVGERLGLRFATSAATSLTQKKPAAKLKLPKLPKLPETKVLVGIGIALLAVLLVAGGVWYYIDVRLPAEKIQQAELARKQTEEAVMAAVVEQEKADELTNALKDARNAQEKAALEKALQDEQERAAAAEEKAKSIQAAAPNTPGPDEQEKEAVTTIQGLIYAKKFGMALYHLQILTSSMDQGRADAITALFSDTLSSYQQARDAAITASQSGDTSAALAELKSFDQKNPGDPRIQMAMASVATRIKPDGTALDSQLKQLAVLADNDSTVANDPAFQALQTKFTHERDQLVDLTSKLKDMKSGPGNRSSRLAHLRTERAIAQKKLQNYEAGSVATGLFNVFTGGGTSLASSIEDKKNEIASCDEQINEIENQPAITQAQTDQAQHDYDNFMATVPW